MDDFHLTPFLEAILTEVKEACGPTLPDWEVALCRRLRARFYRGAVPEPGKHILAEQAMALHARLRAVEARLSAKHAPTPQRGQEIVNYLTQ